MQGLRVHSDDHTQDLDVDCRSVVGWSYNHYRRGSYEPDTQRVEGLAHTDA